MRLVAVLTALLLSFVRHDQQQASPLQPDLSTQRVETIAVSYSKEQRIGEILAADSENRIAQHFEVWGKSPKDFSPAVITYVLEKRDAQGRTFYTATWGKGPIERNSFHESCLANVPDFKDDVYWAATLVEGKLHFESLEESILKEGVIKVLFRSVKGTIQRWMFESPRPTISQAPYDDQRILSDLLNREQNRKTWHTKGWLGPENRCVRYFQSR